MRARHYGVALAIALIPAVAMAEEAAPAAAASAAAPAAPVAAADSASVQSAPAANPGPEASSPAPDALTPAPGKRWCDMKGKMGGMAGHPMGPGKPCGCDGAMHREMVQRLDLIEARLAKIEAMLEGLMRR